MKNTKQQGEIGKKVSRHVKKLKMSYPKQSLDKKHLN